MNQEKKNRIVPFLYKASSIPEALILYENYLKSTNNLEDFVHANSIELFRKTVENRNFVSMLQKTFNNIMKMLEQNFPDTTFHMEGRRKSLLSAEAKTLLYLDLNKSLDGLRDFYAFRIILFDNDISICYKLANQLIEHMILKGFTPCEASEKIDINALTDYPGIEVPKKSGLNKKNMNLVKDYILNPKISGYQSLHMVFRDKNSRCFELQIRTLKMHMHAECSSQAGHDHYKADRYSDFHIDFDRNKIKMNGYGVSQGNVFDYIGLENGLRILQRQKTFI